MLNLQQRINILTLFQKYITGEDTFWLSTKARAAENNPWFIPEFIDNAVQSIATGFLETPALNRWTTSYNVPEQTTNPVNVGITMAGNIPLAGFHDFLCCFISGHKQTIKLSSKDNVLLKHLAEKMVCKLFLNLYTKLSHHLFAQLMTNNSLHQLLFLH